MSQTGVENEGSYKVGKGILAWVPELCLRTRYPWQPLTPIDISLATKHHWSKNTIPCQDGWWGCVEGTPESCLGTRYPWQPLIPSTFSWKQKHVCVKIHKKCHCSCILTCWVKHDTNLKAMDSRTDGQGQIYMSIISSLPYSKKSLNGNAGFCGQGCQSKAVWTQKECIFYLCLEYINQIDIKHKYLVARRVGPSMQDSTGSAASPRRMNMRGIGPQSPLLRVIRVRHTNPPVTHEGK